MVKVGRTKLLGSLGVLLSLIVAVLVLFSMPVVANAETAQSLTSVDIVYTNDLDGITEPTSDAPPVDDSTNKQDEGGFTKEDLPTFKPDDRGEVDDYRDLHIKPNIEQAKKDAGPILNILGWISGVILTIVVVWQVVQTALDLLYIAVPFTRSLYHNPETGKGIPFIAVSDDAMKAITNTGSDTATSTMGAGPGGRPHMDMAGAGGMMGGRGPRGMMGGPSMVGGRPPHGSEEKRGNVIIAYFKSRIATLVFLMIACVVLVSSAVMDLGLNLAAWVLTLINTINDVLGG